MSLPSRLAVLLLPALAACAPMPTLAPAAKPVAAAWQSPLPGGPGQPGVPGTWWQQFDDPAVPELVAAAWQGHPNLAEAQARYREARALADAAGAALWPQVDGQGALSRSRGEVAPGAGATQSNAQFHADATWELDLWGGQRQARQSAEELAEESQVRWAAARVSLGAEVAQTVVQYRACILSTGLLRQDLDSRQRTGDLTVQKQTAGLAAPADVALLEASTAEARQQLVAEQARCELYVLALVALTGRDAASLRQTLAARDRLPTPAGLQVEQVPATAVAQRSDVAAQGHALSAAAAEVHVAWADQWPRITLLGSIGRSVSRLGGVQGGTTTWSFGPSLSLPLFDAGRRSAEVRAAHARYDQQRAIYERLVRDAVRETEEALTRLQAAARREGDAAKAADQYQRHLQARAALFQAGGANALEMEEARRRTVSAQQSLLDIRQERVLAWIALFKALGGGWDASAPALAATQS